MAITPVPDTTHKIHIYEILNRTRLESLLVLTDTDSTQVLARLRREHMQQRTWRFHVWRA